MVQEMRGYAVRENTKDGEPTMKNADMPAMPVHDVVETCSADGNEGPFLLTREYTGLTKRQMFAMVAMQGILTRSANTDRSAIARYAVEYADALLAELERTK